jgi:hypothetical protein
VIAIVWPNVVGIEMRRSGKGLGSIVAGAV